MPLAHTEPNNLLRQVRAPLRTKRMVIQTPPVSEHRLENKHVSSVKHVSCTLHETVLFMIQGV